MSSLRWDNRSVVFYLHQVILTISKCLRVTNCRQRKLVHLKTKLKAQQAQGKLYTKTVSFVFKL